MVKQNLLLIALLTLGACSLAPAYKAPEPSLPKHYKTQGQWSLATPGDRISRDGWWRIYNDPQLDALELQLLSNNPTLSAALAHYAQAQAFVSQASSALLPTVKQIGSAQRIRQSDTRPLRSSTTADVYNSGTLGLQLDYEVDLWGRVRDSVVAGTDEAQASLADLASARLSLQAQLADSYVRLRGLDQQTQLLEQTTDAFTRALGLTQGLHEGGIVSGLDVARASAQLFSAQSQLKQNKVQRALLEHRIAALVGSPASELYIASVTTDLPMPKVPTGVPSELLQRRPDIASAERHIAASNARVGIARSAWFPALTLSAQAGFQSDEFANLLSAPNLFWAVGPALVTTIFDGGLRAAGVDAAKEATEEAASKYRAQVLAAFQQVEDSLSVMDGLGAALEDQRASAREAKYSENLSLARYKQGAVGYLDVVIAQTSSLQAQRSVLDLQTQQLAASVELIRALGGGWSTGDLAVTAEGKGDIQLD